MRELFIIIFKYNTYIVYCLFVYTSTETEMRILCNMSQNEEKVFLHVFFLSLKLLNSSTFLLLRIRETRPTRCVSNYTC